MLKFIEQPPLCPDLMQCPHCYATDRIGIHSRKERRFMCHACGHTFAETTGTPLFDLKYPIWLVIVVLSLLAHGCPPQALVAAFFLDERTVSDGQQKAGQHGKKVQEPYRQAWPPGTSPLAGLAHRPGDQAPLRACVDQHRTPGGACQLELWPQAEDGEEAGEAFSLAEELFGLFLAFP